MNLSNLHPAAGSKHSDAFRVGRGHGSGNGKTAGRGQKGQKSRSGGKIRVGFEGGQMPLYRRLPKKGFKCRNSKQIIAINVSELDRFEADSVVTIETLAQAGLVKNSYDGVKILGNGELNKKLTVQVNAFSKSAAEKIEAAGGKAEVI
ncbi:MAG: 50S ribosomal protein L15 [Eubacterium sp.]|jgi:large subunit ribosomal protein L15|nr:50S ribosomal protein L15 [Eubacterium sp.]